MAVLFISHSSKDDAAASTLETWLRRNDFTDIFIDHNDISGGEKWAQALRDSAGACRVIMCLVTKQWLASDECFGEFKAAWYMGKRIIALLAADPIDAPSRERLAKVLGEDQGLNVAACMDENGGLDLARDPNVERRLKEGLRAAGALAKVGLDPEAFEVDRDLCPTPFPGLASFGDDDADAALFYGRSREIAEALEVLRQMRANGERRPFVILGASGAGKSSLLKAGIIPRLRREAPAWLPLRAFRPGADPLLSFAEALARTCADFGKVEAQGVIRDRLREAWRKAARTADGLAPAGHGVLQAALEAEGRRLRDAAGRGGATILVGIDQAEELARAEGDSGEALADYLRTAVAAATSWQLAVTVRTDSFPELQGHRRFQGLEAHPFDLRALSVFRFESVVEAPAQRYGVAVAPALVDALMEDAPKQDALPLLAFALQRLWRQYAASEALTKDHYDKVGGLKALIEDAAERALRGLTLEAPLPPGPPSKLLDDLGGSAFVPALAQINDQGAVIRRIAEWTSFSEAQRELLDRFDQWRLVRKGEADGGSVEVAHEALFREWTRLKGWLEPERARLEVLRSLQVDAANWERNGNSPGFLNHRDKRLAEAGDLSRNAGYARRLIKQDFDYLAACQAAEQAALAKARRLKALFGALVVLLALVGLGWWNQDFLREQYYWRRTMGPSVLAAEQEKEKAAKPGSDFKECATGCPTMVVVPAGKFTMGSPESEKDRFGAEGPQREVTIAKPFAVGKTEVTFAEWGACVAAGACLKASDNGWGGDGRPVINVSWDDAKQYVAWLSRITGRGYRLLSEAEWEYAARAGNSGRYGRLNMLHKESVHTEGQQQTQAGGHLDRGQYIPFSEATPGSPFTDDDEKVQLGQHAWYSSNSDGKTQPVGKKAANAFGLHDMHGNVWEWVEDPWHDSYEGAPPDGSPWVNDGDASRRVVRGGSWCFDPQLLRAANRNWVATVGRFDFLGFRLA